MNLSTQQITHTLHFNKKILSDLNLDAVAGYEYMQFKMKGFSLTGQRSAEYWLWKFRAGLYKLYSVF